MVSTCKFAGCVAILIATGILVVNGLNNGLALTPPMGFLSWQRFRCQIDCKTYPKNCINENLYMEMADRLVKDGYKDVGYEFVNVDDCWLADERDSSGRLQPNAERFPHGIKYLADYIHSKGLKFGIYEDFGTMTCAGYPGVLGHLEIDAQTFANWGVDYLKLDGCNVNIDQMATGYPEMGRYLNATGRPIVYSCSWPAYLIQNNLSPNYSAIAEACNLWRNYNDIDDSWDSILDIIDYYANKSADLVPNAGPGHWNDPDMLIIGDFGLSLGQSKVQMAIWAIMASPMLISADLRSISNEHKSILQNKELIAVNQDAAGIQGQRIYRDQNQIEVWRRPILPIVNTSKYSYAVAILNRVQGGSASFVSFVLSSLGLTNEAGYQVTDLYDGTSYGLLKPADSLRVSVNPVGVVIVRAVAVSQTY